MLPKSESYDQFSWMIVEQSLEEELTLERSIREIEDCDNVDVLSQLCVAMARQHWHQSKLLKQACAHIALLDTVFSGAEQIL
jgi:hypothetical protein